MKYSSKLILFFLISFTIFISGCNKAQLGSAMGTSIGAAVGGQIGNKNDRLRNAIIGAFAGGVLGYIVGNEMEKYDKVQLNKTFETVPSNQTVTWINPDTKNRYAVTPKPAYQIANNKICRDAYIEAVIDGEYKQVKTTACRHPDGTWEIIN